MMSLADDGDRDLDDPSCAILYGLLRDMAYKLRRAAEEECTRHLRSGQWDGEERPRSRTAGFSLREQLPHRRRREPAG